MALMLDIMHIASSAQKIIWIKSGVIMRLKVRKSFIVSSINLIKIVDRRILALNC